MSASEGPSPAFPGGGRKHPQGPASGQRIPRLLRCAWTQAPPCSGDMETPAPLAHLLQALEAGDLAAAKTAAAALQRSGAGATQLAAEVLHELRQPLLGVKAYAQLLAEESGSGGPLKLLL